MASHAGSPHVVGHRTAITNGGWGVALFVLALAAALAIGAWLIHRATFEDPRDPLSPGSQESQGAAGGHGAPAEHGAAAEHGGAAGDHEAAAPSSH